VACVSQRTLPARALDVHADVLHQPPSLGGTILLPPPASFPLVSQAARSPPPPRASPPVRSRPLDGPYQPSSPSLSPFFCSSSATATASFLPPLLLWSSRSRLYVSFIGLNMRLFPPPCPRPCNSRIYRANKHRKENGWSPIARGEARVAAATAP